MKKLLVLVISLMILFSTVTYSSAAYKDTIEPSGGEMFFDVAILRPIGAFGFLVGSVVYVLSLPITLATKTADSAAQKLVVVPYEYTFQRPVGDIN